MFKMKGDRPQWVIVYDRLAQMDVDEVIKDADLFALLPDGSEAGTRSAFFRAVREIQKDRHRTFERVRMVGYRMVDAPEHERLARNQQNKAKRRLRAGLGITRSTDRSRLTPDERRRIDAIEDHLIRVEDMTNRRMEKNEARIARTEKDAVALADEIGKVRDLLRRYGIE